MILDKKCSQVFTEEDKVDLKISNITDILGRDLFKQTPFKCWPGHDS